MKNLWRSIILCICSLNVLAYANNSAKIKSSGETYIESMEDGNLIAIKLLMKEIDIKNDKTTLGRECTHSRNPCSIVENLEIAINKKSIFVPKSVFLGLSDINTAKVQYKDKKFILEIKGGDASEAYLVRIYFNKLSITTKELYSLLDERNLIEKAIYYKQEETFD